MRLTKLIVAVLVLTLPSVPIKASAFATRSSGVHVSSHTSTPRVSSYHTTVSRSSSRVATTTRSNISSARSTMNTPKTTARTIRSSSSAFHSTSNSTISHLGSMNRNSLLGMSSYYRRPIYSYYNPGSTYFWSYYWLIFPSTRSQRQIANDSKLDHDQLTKNGPSYWLKVGKDQVVSVSKKVYKQVKIGDQVTVKDLKHIEINGRVVRTNE